jgi:hypothetical protein
MVGVGFLGGDLPPYIDEDQLTCAYLGSTDAHNESIRVFWW